MVEFPKFRMQSILNLMKILIYTALVVYFISRLTTIKYSEYYCYGVVLLGIFTSMVVLLGVSSKNVKQLGIIQMIIRLFKTCTPGLLIIAQLIILIIIYATNNDIIYEPNRAMPGWYGVFNNLIFIFLGIQLYIYMKFMNITVRKYEFGDTTVTQWAPVFIPMFALATVLNSGCIGQLWVIITKFTTDG